ncbi:MAG: BlaI/MecI/CopY family transcriptional regulator [Bacteroidetes bacterium]|nr:BlaI/MecI/CopY family transcriptional regulator [Bacteroidota bacterium]MBS1642808.1 BlaI/MecI/CopY family transcriptional regulator [Bacteroidota bacterium]MBS1670299.1 BlaI/MecI/CopY family transcriptional regulator [Bacteroidota bacterium]
MKPLTRAEEQIMQTLWKLEKAYLKEIVEDQPEPKPHTNTVATVLKILVEKGFVGIIAHGRIHEYYPHISKEEYSASSISNLVENYFEGSFADVVSFMVDKKKLKVKDIELLLQQLKTKK